MNILLTEVGKKDECPKCYYSFEGEDIYQVFLEKCGGDRAKALESAGMYGWSEKNPKSFRKEIAIETRQYDGATWYQCPECGVYWKRFDWSDPKYLTGELL